MCPRQATLVRFSGRERARRKRADAEAAQGCAKRGAADADANPRALPRPRKAGSRRPRVSQGQLVTGGLLSRRRRRRRPTFDRQPELPSFSKCEPMKWADGCRAWTRLRTICRGRGCQRIPRPLLRRVRQADRFRHSIARLRAKGWPAERTRAERAGSGTRAPERQCRRASSARTGGTVARRYAVRARCSALPRSAAVGNSRRPVSAILTARQHPLSPDLALPGQEVTCGAPGRRQCGRRLSPVQQSLLERLSPARRSGNWARWRRIGARVHRPDAAATFAGHCDHCIGAESRLTASGDRIALPVPAGGSSLHTRQRRRRRHSHGRRPMLMAHAPTRTTGSPNGQRSAAIAVSARGIHELSRQLVSADVATAIPSQAPGWPLQTLITSPDRSSQPARPRADDAGGGARPDGGQIPVARTAAESAASRRMADAVLVRLHA